MPLSFTVYSFFHKEFNETSEGIVDIITIFLAGLAVLIVYLSFFLKIKWHWRRDDAATMSGYPADHHFGPRNPRISFDFFCHSR
jgi:hypothetical protein